MTEAAREILGDLLPRIRAIAQEARDAVDAAELLQRQRNELIVQAVDEGIPQRVVAQAAGVSKNRVVAILSNTPTEHVV